MPKTISLVFVIITAVVLGCQQQGAPVGQQAGSPSTGSSATYSTALQIGDLPPAFEVEDVTGPAKGESLCYRCKYAGKPTIAIFTRQLGDSVSSLVQEVDKKVEENMDKKLSAFMVVVDDNADQLKPELEHLATAQNIRNTPLTVFNDAAGPEGYGLAEDAQVQVMMWDAAGVKINQPYPNGLSKEEVAELIEKTQQLLN